MYPDLQDRVVVITGAGSGIGRATAERFAAEGAVVVVNDRHEHSAAATVERLGGAAVAHCADIGDPVAASGLVEFACEHFGRIDVLINNAAFVAFGELAGVDDSAWQRCFDVTLNGAFYTLRAALAVMRRQSDGSIINISSGAALAGEPRLGAYGAAKAGLVNLTKTAAVENAGFGIRVNAILPGPIDTPAMHDTVANTPGGEAAWARQIPAGRLGRPEEIANAICFLASSQASYINGAALCVDGAVSARTNSPRFD